MIQLPSIIENAFEFEEALKSLRKFWLMVPSLPGPRSRKCALL